MRANWYDSFFISSNGMSGVITGLMKYMFFIETGTIHAIGAGILLAEIQQTSDITYRVYDWDRVASLRVKDSRV